VWRRLKALARVSPAHADEHGLATLRVVSKGEMRVIESVSLRVNSVEFEHALHIDAQRTTHNAQRTTMRAGEVCRRDATAPSCCR